MIKTKLEIRSKRVCPDVSKNEVKIAITVIITSSLNHFLPLSSSSSVNLAISKPIGKPESAIASARIEVRLELIFPRDKLSRP